MKSKVIQSALSLALVATLGLSTRARGEESEALLRSKAKVSQEDATKIALTKVTDGTVKSAKIETEDGKVVWVFDITSAKSAKIVEVQVDADTGKVVSSHSESPKAQEAERLADQSSANLKAGAVIDEQDAARTALAKVLDGSVKSASLEMENGRLVWDFDVAMPKTGNVTEVLVDAKTGLVVDMQVRTPEEQASDAASDKVSADFKAQAKISETEATQTALARAPEGTVRRVDIGMVEKKLVWSFDFSTPKSADITSVQVDAMTGAVVSSMTRPPKN